MRGVVCVWISRHFFLSKKKKNSARMTSEKDYNKHKTQKQLSQLKDRLDKEGVETHGTSAPPPSCTAPLGRAPSTGVIASGFGHLPLQLDLHQVMLNAPSATVHVCGKSGKLKSQHPPSDRYCSKYLAATQALTAQDIV